MRRLVRLLSKWPSEKALRAACVLGLVAIAIMVAGVLDGTSLPVVASMSVSQAFGVLAGFLYAVTVAAEAGKK
ncbi:MAG: hypothetical protein JNK82_38880 [Myxococcaceae bacterium]|nr:hypothetical protein [Myxococcaceae bacterium]